MTTLQFIYIKYAYTVCNKISTKTAPNETGTREGTIENRLPAHNLYKYCYINISEIKVNINNTEN